MTGHQEIRDIFSCKYKGGFVIKRIFVVTCFG